MSTTLLPPEQTWASCLVFSILYPLLLVLISWSLLAWDTHCNRHPHCLAHPLLTCSPSRQVPLKADSILLQASASLWSSPEAFSRWVLTEPTCRAPYRAPPPNEGWELKDKHLSSSQVDLLASPQRVPKRGWTGGSISGKDSMDLEANRKETKVNDALMLDWDLTEALSIFLYKFMQIRRQRFRAGA